MTRRSVHRKGIPEKMCHESAIKHIMEENKVIKTKKHVYLLMREHMDHPHGRVKPKPATSQKASHKSNVHKGAMT